MWHEIVLFVCVDLPKLLATLALVFLGFLVVLFFATLQQPAAEKVDPTISELATNPETYLSKSPLSEEYITVYGTVQGRDWTSITVKFDYTIQVVSTDFDGTTSDQLTTKQYTGTTVTFTDGNSSIVVFIPKGVEVLNIDSVLEGLWLKSRGGDYYFVVNKAY